MDNENGNGPKNWQGRCHTSCEHAKGTECPECRRALAPILRLCSSCPIPCPHQKPAREIVVPEKIYRDNGHPNVIPLFPRKKKPEPTPPTNSTPPEGPQAA